MVRVITFRQCGTRRHDDPLYYLMERGLIDKVERVRYSIPRHIGEGIVHRRITKNLRDSFHSLMKIMELPFYSDQNIVVGVAPYSIMIPYLLRLKKRNNVIYHTSSPPFDRENYIKKPYFSFQISMWEDFLNGIKAIAVTKCAKTAVERYGAKAYHIPHAVDTRIFKPIPSLKGDGKVKVLFVGYMVESKGVLDLLDIARNTQEAEFWFVGKGKLSPLVKKMEGKYPVKHFNFILDREELARVYNMADIFVLHSEELFGIVLIEAMACGLPVIGVKSFGPSEIIDDGINGFLLPERNSSMLREKLEILIHDEGLRKKMGEKAREKAVREYDMGKIAMRWWEVINE